ncbi:helix-turn-helix domain-containing protein (plasmid) [Rhodococcus pyridinivorans]|jgi:excisionase family DNA binding protein|uniref:helix-turn-helix domain-containing protein n=1 Tax=Rhodococcus TaxID=1827 RepID=UPI0007180E6F|nr:MULTISPECIES: helix-turn-helix domain-containing protein [Rhodococcus]MYV31819.1 helix-turn-helix domain-containing protein [Rhodococcus erythropolis]MBP1054285.1 helix-turn-helix domain-containing protein [Rhodococcus qingshengii]MBP2521061.1 excisionase family DNA binding protein [Rhodococcus sp. PvP104]MDA3637755.1 helix-turn-helix domain-containing protein [Rhodococcus sp. C-2]UVT27738.1 helix-turn-helix domain-containing protein [Rhodococcus pyridinivorans]
MSQGSESAPQDLQDASRLIYMFAARGENVGVVALPETAPSFFVDCRSGGPDMPVSRLTSDASAAVWRDAVAEWLRDAHPSPRRPLHADTPHDYSLWVTRCTSDAQPGGLVFVQDMPAADSSPEDATEADADEWGPAIPDEKVATLEQANLKLQVEHRRQELSASMSRTQAADLLGVSPQTVSEWVAQHKLVGLKDGREWRFPAWQFTPDNAEPVLPDLDRLVATFPGGEVSLSRWMNRANDNFAGRTPAQEMARDSDHVIAIVETLAAT